MPQTFIPAIPAVKRLRYRDPGIVLRDSPNRSADSRDCSTAVSYTHLDVYKRQILSGAERGPKRCAVCLNAGAALYVTGRAESLEDGGRMAEQLIDNGSTQKKLEEFIRESNR